MNTLKKVGATAGIGLALALGVTAPSMAAESHGGVHFQEKWQGIVWPWTPVPPGCQKNIIWMQCK
ncbi:hypothetical protein [Sciscionella marina]|uniref:hypothetical protein n=1 Tax=Sciscionella marina TaxID=508770 RepID=UPI00036C95CD|nr:hypothetical protein [Sciscionella marina]